MERIATFIRQKKKEKTTVYRFLYDLLYWPERQRNLEDLKLVSVDSKALITINFVHYVLCTQEIPDLRDNRSHQFLPLWIQCKRKTYFLRVIFEMCYTTMRLTIPVEIWRRAPFLSKIPKMETYSFTVSSLGEASKMILRENHLKTYLLQINLQIIGFVFLGTCGHICLLEALS